MKVAEPLSLRVAKTLSDSLTDSQSFISVVALSNKLHIAPADIEPVIKRFEELGMARVDKDYIFLTEDGLSVAK